MKITVLLLAFLVFVSGCIQPTQSTPVAQGLCIQICKSALNSNQSLANGSCLSDNNANWTVSDWVCDVVHSPRQAVDDQPENQCQAFRNGQAHHFVEVDTSCNLIKVV